MLQHTNNKCDLIEEVIEKTELTEKKTFGFFGTASSLPATSRPIERQAGNQHPETSTQHIYN